MKVLFNSIYYLFVAGVALIALLLLATMIPIPGNFQAKIVKSGSMEPYIRTGGMVFVRPAEAYVKGDVITFGQDTKTQIPTTHRIIEVHGTGASMTFTTKGDANDGPDQSDTRLQDVKGKVIFSVPYLGYVLDFAKKPLGFGLLIGIPATVVIVEEIMKIVHEVIAIRRRRQFSDDTSN